MAKQLREIKLSEISLVDNPANQHAKVVLQKMDAGTPSDFKPKEDVVMTPETLEKKLGDAETQNAELTKNYSELDQLVDAIVKTASGLGIEIDRTSGAVAKKAEPETISVDGEQILKSTVPESLLKRLVDLEKAQEVETLTKRAKSELPNLAGSDIAKGELLKAVDAMDKDTREDMLKALKAADAAVSNLFKSVGNDSIDESTPEAQLDMLAKGHAEKTGVTFHKAYEAMIDTPKGQELLKSMGAK